MAQQTTAKQTRIPDVAAAPAPKARQSTAPASVLAATLVAALHSKKGQDVTVIDMRDVSGITDFFIICTGSSDLQIKALADAVRLEAKAAHEELPWHVEGYEERRWVVMDYVDVVVHIFDQERRTYYDLERLWADAPMEHVADDATTVALFQDAPET